MSRISRLLHCSFCINSDWVIQRRIRETILWNFSHQQSTLLMTALICISIDLLIILSRPLHYNKKGAFASSLLLIAST